MWKSKFCSSTVGKTAQNHDVTTTAFHSRDGVLTVGCTFLSPNMGSIFMAKKLNFAFVRPQKFLEIVIVMLQKGSNTIQSRFEVTFREQVSFARNAGCSTIAGRIPNWWSSCTIYMKIVIFNIFWLSYMSSLIQLKNRKKNVPWYCKAHIHLSNDTCALTLTPYCYGGVVISPN